jgi:hypothetical protein
MVGFLFDWAPGPIWMFYRRPAAERRFVLHSQQATELSGA